ncbi:hypothetical protein HID58_003202 [Brassica napus]|uniref:Uncharacterized protein n=2 Tax=Brassica TaxID=3705 RepID=A0ABQ8EPF7_BRANA|nr:hypothetical protein HID58_003202 [Brassica napus]
MSYLPPVWTLANYANTFPETRDYRMTVEMLICALDHPISNLMALAEDFKEEDATTKYLLSIQAASRINTRTENPRWLYESLLQAVDQHVDKKLTTTIIVFNSPTLGSFPRSSDLPPPNFTNVFTDEDALPEHLITGYICSNLHVDIVPKGNRRSRIPKIAKFILFHALTHRRLPTTLLVLAEDILRDHPLFMTICQAVTSRGLNLIFQTPKSILTSELYLDPQLRSWF